MDPIRIFVGTDRSQLLAVKVLEYSIRRHTPAEIELTPMCDLPIPTPKDPRQGQRTGFSFSRFCIPKLAGYSGKAIYMDADMLVRKDIRDLWNIPFGESKIVVQEDLSERQAKRSSSLAPKRLKQCAVMLLDCGALSWKIEDIIDGLDRGLFDYSQLMNDLCILKESEVSYSIPFAWNSLEYLDENTCLIHYTDMATQPWVSPFNKNSEIWYEEVRLMLADGSLSEEEIINEIRQGFFRPSLLNDIRWSHIIPQVLQPAWKWWNSFVDNLKGYKKHAKVYQLKANREAAIKSYISEANT